MKNTKRILSIFLVLVMLLGMIPFSSVPASAATTYEVATWGELENVLTLNSGSTPITITLTANVNCSHEKNSDGHQTTQIIGNKTVDLNGYTIRCDDKSNYRTIPDDPDEYYNDFGARKLFDVMSGASLTINDSSNGSGSIQYDAYMIGYTTGGYLWEDTEKDTNPCPGYGTYTDRDVFDVHGTLTINNGRIEGGRSKKQWYALTHHSDTYSGVWTGYAYQQIYSTAVTVYNGGKLTVNGGYVQGRGSTAVRIAKGSEVYINGGTISGKGGGPVFNSDVPTGSLHIKSGHFTTETLDVIREWDKSDIFHVNYFDGHLIYICQPSVRYGVLGKVNIPDDAWKESINDVVVRVGNTTYDTYESKNALDLRNTTEDVLIAPADLIFSNQNPEMPMGYDTWHMYQAYGETTNYTFNHIDLTPKQISDGYYVERSYVLRNAVNKQLVASESGITGTDTVTFTHTWNEVGTFTLYETLTLKDNTGAKVKDLTHTFHIFVQPAVDHIEITTPPTQTTYYSQVYKTNGYSKPSFYGEGMVVTAHYTDGTTRDVTEYVDFERTLVIDATQVAVSYTDPIFKEEHFAFQPVTVEKEYQISITDGEAYRGGRKDYAPAGMILDLYVTNMYDSSKYELGGWTITRDDTGAAVEVTKRPISGTYYFTMPDSTITVKPIWNLKKIIKSIQIQSAPTKTSYYEGELFNVNGMVLCVFYTDGTYEEISGDALKPYLHLHETINNGIEGYLGMDHTTVYVRYNGFTATQPITVAKSQNIYHVEFTLEGYGYGKNVADAKVTINTEHISFTTITTTTNYSFWRADLTDNAQVTSGTFGRHEYEVSVAITCDSGYIKSFNKDTVTLNGIKAYSLRSVSGGKYLISFLLPSFVVDTLDVTVTNISAGNKPNDLKVTVPSGEHYQLTGVKSWEIKNGENYAAISGNEKLQAGKTYRVMMNFSPTDDYLFASGIATNSMKVNGEYVSREYDSSTETVTLIYEFTVPEKTLSTLISNVTSFGDGEEKVIVELYKNGEATATYTETVTGTVENPALVVITGIEDGTYTMKVTKANHEVYTATITATGEAIYKDVTLEEIPAFLKGDVNANGVIDSTDYLRIKGHFIGTYNLHGKIN